MPRKTDPFWIPHVTGLKAKGLTAKQIEVALDAMEDVPPAVGAAPRERTIRAMTPTPEALEEERQLRWPEAMGPSGLPWEASNAILRLLRYHFDHGRARPTVRLARWYWRLRLAAGDDAPDEYLVPHATLVASIEARGDFDIAPLLRLTEAELAYRIWELPEWSRYIRAQVEGRVPEDGIPLPIGVFGATMGSFAQLHHNLDSEEALSRYQPKPDLLAARDERQQALEDWIKRGMPNSESPGDPERLGGEER